MYKLLYSQKANDLFGHNIALNTNGEQVAYTAMYNEEIYDHIFYYHGSDAKLGEPTAS